MADGKELKPQHLELNVTAQPEASLQPVMPQEQEPKTLEDTEREAIKRAMDRYEGNMSQVASVLGISRQTLYSKLKRYGI